MQQSAQHEAVAARQENVRLTTQLQQAHSHVNAMHRKLENADKLRQRETEQRERLSAQQTSVQQEQLDSALQALVRYAMVTCL